MRGRPSQLLAQHVGEAVDPAEIVALQLVAGVEPGGIPAEGHALRPRPPDRLADPEVLAHVVEDELAAPGAAHRVGEGVDVADRAFEILGMMPRLVHQLDEEDGRLVLERDTGIGIHVLQDLAEVVHLRGDGGRVGAHPLLAEVPSEPRRGRVSERVGPVGAVQLDRTEQHVDPALPRAGDEVVLQVEVIVGDQVAGAVGGLPVTPEGEPETVPAHPGEVRHVLVDHPLSVAVDVTGGPVVGGGGQHVVGAEQGDLLAVVAASGSRLPCPGTPRGWRLHSVPAPL